MKSIDVPAEGRRAWGTSLRITLKRLNLMRIHDTSAAF
jgi:hypothetical protein